MSRSASVALIHALDGTIRVATSSKKTTTTTTEEKDRIPLVLFVMLYYSLVEKNAEARLVLAIMTNEVKAKNPTRTTLDQNRFFRKTDVIKLVSFHPSPLSQRGGDEEEKDERW